MRNPFSFLKGIWKGSAARSTPPAPAEEASPDNNPFMKVPVQPEFCAPIFAYKPPVKAAQVDPATSSSARQPSVEDAEDETTTSSSAEQTSIETVEANPAISSSGQQPSVEDVEDKSATLSSAQQSSVENAQDNSTTPSSGTNARRKLQPKRQHERRTTTHPKRDYAAEITYEEDDGSLPEGYLGTWKGAHYYSPDYGVHLPCGNGLHHLTCNHWATTPTETPCGVNCHDPNINVAPFRCLTCRSIIQDVIANKITAAESAKVKEAIRSKEEAYIVGYLVEFVSKHVKMKGNITEIVVSIVRHGDYLRDCCAAEPPVNARGIPLAQQIKEYHEYHAEKKFAADNAKVGTKRKQPEQFHLPAAKRVKRRIHSSHKSVDLEERGVKRESTSQAPPGKKRQTAPPVQYGEVRFASPSAGVVGPLVRKRGGEEMEEGGGNKRAKTDLPRGGDGVAPISTWDEDEEL
jgi:hypothetical protein